jgi:hypothetical protein
MRIVTPTADRYTMLVVAVRLQTHGAHPVADAVVYTVAPTSR